MGGATNTMLYFWHPCFYKTIFLGQKYSCQNLIFLFTKK